MKRARFRSFGPLLTALLLLPGCYDVYSGLVPVALPPMAPPERGRVEARAQGTVTTGGEGFTDPAESPRGLYVPRGGFGGTIGIRVSRWFSLNPLAGVAIAEGGYQPFGPPTGSAPRGAAFFFGLSPTFHVPFDRERTVVTIGVDAAFLGVPLDTSEGNQLRPSGLFGGTVGVGRWVSEWLRLRVELSARNQGIVLQPSNAPSGLGYLALTFGGSARAQLADEVAVELSTQFVGVPPVGVLFPTVTVSVIGTIGDMGEADPHHPERPLAARERRRAPPGDIELRERDTRD